MNETCKWFFDDPEDLAWQTSCGGRWQFMVDGPEENGVVFCPYCGHSIVAYYQEHERVKDEVVRSV